MDWLIKYMSMYVCICVYIYIYIYIIILYAHVCPPNTGPCCRWSTAQVRQTMIHCSSSSNKHGRRGGVHIDKDISFWGKQLKFGVPFVSRSFSTNHQWLTLKWYGLLLYEYYSSPKKDSESTIRIQNSESPTKILVNCYLSASFWMFPYLFTLTRWPNLSLSPFAHLHGGRIFSGFVRTAWSKIATKDGINMD